MLICIGVLIDSWSNKKIRYVLITVLLGLCFVTKYPMKETITIVDIGQGDSIFLQDRFNQHTILIDTGGKIEFVSEKNGKAVQKRQLLREL